MAYRQYIGARYVPLMDGPWNSEKNYEPLTVVEDGNGNSYTSKKNVPAGTPLSNREYWALTGQFSGAILSLQNRMNNVEGWINDNKKGGCAIFVGDSYSVGTGYNAKLATLLGYDADHRAIFDIASYGFTDANPAGGRWLDYIQSNLDRITFDYNDVDLIVITGGLNDALNTSETPIVNAMNQTMSWLKSTFPKATVKVGFIGAQMMISNVSQGTLYASIYSITLPAYKKACVEFGAEYLTGAEWILYNRARMRDSDASHPLNNQTNWIAENLAEAVKSGSVVVQEGCDCTLSAGTGYDAPNVSSFRVTRTDNVFRIIPVENPRGLIQQFKTAAVSLGTTSAISFVDCLVSNTLTVLPLQEQAVVRPVLSCLGIVFKNNTSTQKATLPAEVGVKFDESKTLKITFRIGTTYQLLADDYTKLGYGIFIPNSVQIF